MWQRIGLRIIGVGLGLLALWFYIRGFYAVGNGDFHPSVNYKGVGTFSNRDLRISIVLAVGGVIAFGFSLPCNEKTDDDDQNKF